MLYICIYLAAGKNITFWSSTKIYRQYIGKLVNKKLNQQHVKIYENINYQFSVMSATGVSWVQHERHECDTSETGAIRVQRECETSATRAKKFDFDNDTI